MPAPVKGPSVEAKCRLKFKKAFYFFVIENVITKDKSP